MSTSRPPSRSAVLLALAATVALSVVLGTVGRPLHVEGAPLGVISFEFATTRAASEAMLSAWGPEGRRIAMTVQALDCVFPVVYGGFGALLSRRMGVEWAARACVAAALLDELVENPLLDLQLWWAHGAAVPAAVAAIAASAKFALLVFAGVALVARRVRR